MHYKDQLIRLTQQSAEDFIRAIRAIPEDKLNWKVLDAGRSPMDLFQEVAQAPTYPIGMLEKRSAPDFNPETFGKLKEARAAWDTLDKCETALRENLTSLFAAIRAFPDEDLSHEIDLPFAENLRRSMADIMAYPYWNNSYHLGQISFIQTLYGDWEMR
jgi:hypothetical protein